LGLAGIGHPAKLPETKSKSREDAVTSRQPDRRPHSLANRSGEAASAAGNSRLVRQAVISAQAGDAEGLHFLYVRYAADVQRYVASFVNDHHEAEDITQNIFAKLMTAIRKYEQREAPFVAWIMRVARNAALDHMRARRMIPTEEVRIADNGQVQVGIDRGRDLRHALEQLPADQREVLVLRHIAGLSPVEIAATLEKSESSVHGLHHRGRRTLQTKLSEIGAAPVVARPAA
jgi:RNA polymerase sigma-70 factor (ECF subfamily)